VPGMVLMKIMVTAATTKNKNFMAKYTVTIQYERTQVVEVEANSKGEAMGLVNEGEFENEQIIDTEDDYVEIVGVTLVK
jgi:hypothetical protein